jgi:SAM-dependent methyltransferase
MINHSEAFSYIGNELELFENASNWKKYLFTEIEKHVGRKSFSIEVGCGIGANSRYIARFSNRYVGIEPDAFLCKKAILRHPEFEFINGFFSQAKIESDVKPDLVLLIDVLEHIEDDYLEITKIWESLEQGATLVILVPAHQFLFSKFDASVGHYRRYSKKSLTKVMSSHSSDLRIIELDSVGFVLSLASKILNPNGEMTLKKVRLWNFLVPISKKIDSLLRFKIGKSILLIANK